jgi:hypothetical protein
MTRPLRSTEQMQQFLEHGVGDETLGSRTLGTLTKGKLFEAPSAGFGQQYAAENLPILKDMDSISRGVYNTIAPYGEKAFDIIDTIFRLPGAAVADIAQIAGVNEDDVNEIQALINVGVGLKLPEANPVMINTAASKAVKDISKAVNVAKTEAKWLPEKSFTSTLNEKQLQAFNNYVDSRGKKGRANLINAIFEDPKLASDPFIRSNLATALNEKGIHNTVQGVKDTFNRAIRGLYLKKGEVISSEAKAGWGQSAEAASSEAGRYSQKFITKESFKKMVATKKEKAIAAGKTKAWDEIPEGAILTAKQADDKRKGTYTWDKIVQSLPDSPKKKIIQDLINDIREMNPKGTLHADHFIEYQSGGKNNPLNIVAMTETGHYGQIQTKQFNKILKEITDKNPGISKVKAQKEAMSKYIDEGYYLSKTTFVSKINKLNKKISEAWKNPRLRESIRNRTHIRVKEKDALYNSHIQGKKGHLFDAKTPGKLIKKGDDVDFRSDKLDPELQEILTVNNSNYGSGASTFGKTTNAEDHLIDQLSRLKYSTQEHIITSFGNVKNYKKFVENLKKTIPPTDPKAEIAKVGGVQMHGGGIASISHLTRAL